MVSKALIDSYNNHDEFVLENNVKWNEMKWNETINQKSKKCCAIYFIKTMETYCITYKKTANKSSSVRRNKAK